MAEILTPNSFGADSQSTARVLANVNGKPITEEDVNRFIMAMGRNGQAYNNPQGRAAVLEQLIAQRLFLLDAQRNLLEREQAFKDQLAAVKEQLLMEYAISKCVDSVRVTEDDVRGYYDSHKDEMTEGETVNASHILVDSEEKANEILASIQAGEISFEDAARDNSSCPSSSQGGNLGDFGRGQMVPEFDQACFDMEEGEVRGPIKTQFGYHLIRLNKKNPAEPLSYNDVRAQLYEQITRERQQAAYQSKINQLKIMYPVDKV
jgi:peptidyl-prolyl cis-trans isomerase C